MNKIKTITKVRLSLEPAYQVIYWSICWLTLFLSLILLLEKQHPILNGVVVSFWILLLYFGVGSTAKVTEDALYIRYFRGIKKISYPMSSFNKLSFSEKRLIILERKDGKDPLIFYVNKKNKKNIVSVIQQSIPEVKLEETLKLNKNEMNQAE